MPDQSKTTVGFSGSRRGMTDAQLATFRCLMDDVRPSDFHHGACVGADEDAAELFSVMPSLRTVVVAWPGKSALGGANQFLSTDALAVSNHVMQEQTHFARNRNIVNATDRLIACPWQTTRPAKGTGGGTWMTVEYAERTGKPVTIIWPDGTTTED